MDAHLKAQGRCLTVSLRASRWQQFPSVAADYGDTGEPTWSPEMDGDGRPNLPYNSSNDTTSLHCEYLIDFYSGVHKFQSNADFM